MCYFLFSPFHLTLHKTFVIDWLTYIQNISLKFIHQEKYGSNKIKNKNLNTNFQPFFVDPFDVVGPIGICL